MMRASMGNAVMDIAAPRNSIASNLVARSEKRPGVLKTASARAAPRTIGTTMPAAEIEAALRARATKACVLNSTPTRNI